MQEPAHNLSCQMKNCWDQVSKKGKKTNKKWAQYANYSKRHRDKVLSSIRRKILERFDCCFCKRSAWLRLAKNEPLSASFRRMQIKKNFDNNKNSSEWHEINFSGAQEELLVFAFIVLLFFAPSILVLRKIISKSFYFCCCCRRFCCFYISALFFRWRKQ